MDILSYGIANKASKERRYTYNNILGPNIKGAFTTMQERIDSIEEAIQAVTKQAENLIVKNAVNIMKAHAKLNVIAQTKKYEMHNMIFDDLLDLSGIDLENSRNFTHDEISGEIIAGEDCVIETIPENFNVERILLTTSTSNIDKIIKSYENYEGIASISRINQFLSIHTDKKYKYFIEYDNQTMFHVSNNELEFYKINSDVYVNGTSQYTFLNKNGFSNSRSSGESRVVSSITYYKVIQFENFQFDNDNIIIKLKDNYNEIEYYISSNNERTWNSILKDTLYHFGETSNNNIKLKFNLPKGKKLKYYAFTWR